MSESEGDKSEGDNGQRTGTESLGNQDSFQEEKYDFDELFQLKILSLLVSSPNAILDLKDVVKPRFFENRALREVCDWIYEFYEKYGSPPSYDEFLEYSDHKKETCRVDSDLLYDVIHHIFQSDFENLEYVRDEAETFAQENAWKNAIRKGAQAVDKGDFDKIPKFMEEAMMVGQSDSDSRIEFFGEIMDYMEQKHEEQKDIRRTHTGFRTLDSNLDGGLPTKKLGIVQAPTNVGKTLALVNFGVGAIRSGLDVFHYTIEDSAYDVGKKYLARILDMPVREVAVKRDEVREKLDEVSEQFGGEFWLGKLPYRTTANDIDSRLARHYSRSQFSPDVVIVDYMDDMDAVRTDGSINGESTLYVEQGEIAVDLVSMAERHNSAIWTATQSNREAMRGSHVGLHHGADSIRKFQKAHVVLGLCQSEGERERGIIRAVCNKSKVSRADWSVKFEVKPEEQCLMEVEEEV